METLPALQESSVQMLMSQAIDKGVSVETLERLMTMREKLKAEYASEQFAVAMSAFQSDCPIIKKTKSVTTKSGSVAYRYAPIESIVFQVKHLLKENGFSYAIETVTLDKTVTATCTAKHMLGHSESSSFTVPLGSQTAVMSDTQVVAAALTFAKRYAFCNVFGIMTGDSDNDGAAVVVEKKVTDQKLLKIEEMLKNVEYTEEVLLKSYNVKTASELTEKDATDFISKLEKYIERLNKEKGGDATVE